MPTYLSPGVYVEEAEAAYRPIEGVGTAVAAFVGLAAAGPFHTPTLVSNWTQFSQSFGQFMPGSYLAHAVYGYFLNGGGSCYVVRVGDPAGEVAGARAELPAASNGGAPALRVASVEEGTAGNDLTVDIARVDPSGDDGGTEAEPTYTVVVRRGGQAVETFEGLSTKRGKQNVATAVNAQSTLVRVEELAAGVELANGSVRLAGGGVPTPARLSPDDYVGDSADRTGFAGLEAIDTVTILCVPDLMAAHQQGLLDLDGVKAVQSAMIAHCELMGDRVAVIDPPPALNPQQVREWRVDQAAYDSKYAAMYWPWLKVMDPDTGELLSVPPSGHMAGVWGRNDDTRGVHKAPANEVVRGAIGVETVVSRIEQELLNPQGINCIRPFPGRGIRVWGARTLSSDPAWRYLNVRRLFNYLESSILAGTQWAVFEPNDSFLWGRLRRTITAFLVNEYRKGALFGRSADEAFFVKCDDETNPSEGIDAGQVVCEVGVAPVKPAEFVVFRLSQFSGGTSTVAE